MSNKNLNLFTRRLATLLLIQEGLMPKLQPESPKVDITDATSRYYAGVTKLKGGGLVEKN